MQYSVRVPRLGGLILYILVLFSYVYNIENNYNIYFFISTLVVLLGIIDDYYELFPIQKLAGQIIIVGIFLISINSNVLNYNFILFFFTFLIMINSANLIDGSDGVLGVLSVQSLFVLYINSNNNLILYFLLWLLILIPFNLPNAKFYFGDAGALFIGFSLAYFGLEIDNNIDINKVCYTLLIFPMPLLDTIYTILRRILNGKNIFSKDTLHIHHIIFRKVKSKWISLIIISAFQAILLIVVYFLLFKRV